jgi:hypothetical protein
VSAPRDLTCCRWSELTALCDSPEHYRHLLANPRKDTPAMALGGLAHALTLSPGEPHDCVAKDWDGRTKEGKARAAEVAAMGMTVVDADDWAAAHGMAEAVRRHPGAQQILGAPGMAEVELAWDLDGERYGGRADWIGASGAIWDLKTCRSAALRTCQRTIIDRHYHGQLAWYRWGLEASGGPPREEQPMPGIIWVENAAPYCVRAQELSPAFVRLGDALVDELLALRAQCLRSGRWPGYGDEIQVVDPPIWAVEREEDDE